MAGHYSLPEEQAESLPGGPGLASKSGVASIVSARKPSHLIMGTAFRAAPWSISGTPCHPSGAFLAQGVPEQAQRERINRRCVSVDEDGWESVEPLAKVNYPVVIAIGTSGS